MLGILVELCQELSVLAIEVQVAQRHHPIRVVLRSRHSLIGSLLLVHLA